MLVWSRILIFTLVLTALSCGGEQKPATPVETFKTYVKAFKKKDFTAMKLLLSNASIKMHEQEAKAQNVTLDEIIKRETLLSENQTTVEYKNEKIDGDKATLDVKTSGRWETLPFVREDAVWKIDKQGYADRMIKDIEDQQKRAFDDMNNFNAEPPMPERNQ